MNIDDHYFNRKKFNFALKNFYFWLTRCLELDSAWVDAMNEVGWQDLYLLSEADQKLLSAVEQQLTHARSRLKHEKAKLLVWIEQAPFGRKNR